MHSRTNNEIGKGKKFFVPTPPTLQKSFLQLWPFRMDAADDQLLLDDAPVQDPEIVPGPGVGGAQNPPRRAPFLTKAFTELACDRSQVTNELTAYQVRICKVFYNACFSG